MAEYPSGDEERDAVIELLCDEWPIHLDYRTWDERRDIVLHLLGVLDHARLSVIDLGEPVTAEELRGLLRARAKREVDPRAQAGNVAPSGSLGPPRRRATG